MKSCMVKKKEFLKPKQEEKKILLLVLVWFGLVFFGIQWVVFLLVDFQLWFGRLKFE